MDIVVDTPTMIDCAIIGLLLVGLIVGAVVAFKLSRNSPTYDTYG